jgi:polyhydroxyalkanoate synthesis regulator phasin
MSGCGYPEVSPKTYEVANALYAASNRQSTEHIEKAAAITDELLAAGEISEREAGWLKAITEQARSGDWDSAAKEARALIADQSKTAP